MVGGCSRGAGSEKGSGGGAAAIAMLANSILVAIEALLVLGGSHLWFCRRNNIFFVTACIVDPEHLDQAMVVELKFHLN